MLCTSCIRLWAVCPGRPSANSEPIKYNHVLFWSTIMRPSGDWDNQSQWVQTHTQKGGTLNISRSTNHLRVCLFPQDRTTGDVNSESQTSWQEPWTALKSIVVITDSLTDPFQAPDASFERCTCDRVSACFFLEFQEAHLDLKQKMRAWLMCCIGKWNRMYIWRSWRGLSRGFCCVYSYKGSRASKNLQFQYL